MQALTVPLAGYGALHAVHKLAGYIQAKARALPASALIGCIESVENTINVVRQRKLGFVA